MSVFDNVAYGLRVRKRPEAEVTARVREALELVQLGELGTRSASKLSGGQQQRVALARAFVFSPSVLLFDEPLSNLDAKLRAEMRVELKELQRRLDITSVYVTHDLEEALAISDRIVVMRDGVIEQVGTPGEIYDRPRNTFVADFVGSANLIRGRRRPDLERDGLVVIQTPGGALVHGAASGPVTTKSASSGRSETAMARSAAPGCGASGLVRMVASREAAHGSSAARACAPGDLGERVAGPDSPARVPGRFHSVSRRLGRPDADRAPGHIRAAGRGRRGLRLRRSAALRAPRGVSGPLRYYRRCP